MLSDIPSCSRDIDRLPNGSNFSRFASQSISPHQLHGSLSIGRRPSSFLGHLPCQIFPELHLFYLRLYCNFLNLTYAFATLELFHNIFTESTVTVYILVFNEY